MGFKLVVVVFRLYLKLPSVMALRSSKERRHLAFDQRIHQKLVASGQFRMLSDIPFVFASPLSHRPHSTSFSFLLVANSVVFR